MEESRENFKAWNQKALRFEEFWGLSSDAKRLQYLCSTAILAANSHNTQPWLFAYDSLSQSLTFLLNGERVLPVSDVKGRQAIISLGCAMANFEVAAMALGCELNKEVLLKDEEKISSKSLALPIVRYQIRGKTEVHNESMSLYQAIFSRRVDRGEYDHDRPLPEGLTQKIQGLGADYKVKTILISDWSRKVALAELQSQADSFVINHKEFAEELVNDWMIENDSGSFLGMPGDTFRLNAQQTHKIKDRFKKDMGFESDDAMAIAQLGKKGILSCQCVGMLTVEKDCPTQWLNAGIVLQRGALLFESESIAWAVHAGLAEVSQVNMLMLRPIAMTTQRPVILFRAGYLKKNETRSPHSPRIPIEKLWSQA